ncbi:MAG: Glycogen synthase [candidate division WS6 bacterium OLB20]|uniref:starch synthase n=1 Tax=candidate division WS6 bacterium OLB20 TaxID=1617426 RepID=A0A136M010_9BACT|nr:MAG: Glycogen synthase [candidate division WS6 bacterium OLB20]
MERLKVLMFGWEYAPIVSGGLGVVCRSIAQNLVSQGVDLTFVLPRLPRRISVDNMQLVNAAETEISEESLTYISVTTMLSPYMTAEDFAELRRQSKLRREDDDTSEMYGANLFEEVIKYAARAFDIALENTHDVIHAHDWMTFKAAINAKSISRKPLIVHIHATEVERTAGNPHPTIYEYEREGMQAADKVITVSELTRQTVIQHYGIAPEKIEVVHNAVDEVSSVPAKTLLSETHDYKTVLFLARLAPSKGADYLLHAAQKVLQMMTDVKFVFVGKGSMEKELINLSKELGIEDHVIFTGFLNHDQVDEAYKRANLFVMPSVAEPFGITVLEAIRNGTPVLMSKQSGAGEVVRNALKVDFWDTDEMANKILAVLKHATLAETLRENGLTDLERMSWEAQIGKIISIYNSLA